MADIPIKIIPNYLNAYRNAKGFLMTNNKNAEDEKAYLVVCEFPFQECSPFDRFEIVPLHLEQILYKKDTLEGIAYLEIGKGKYTVEMVKWKEIIIQNYTEN